MGIYLACSNCQTLKIVGPFIYQFPCHAWATGDLAPAQPTLSSAEVCCIFCLPSCAGGTRLQHLNRELELTIFSKTDLPDTVLFSENIFFFSPSSLSPQKALCGRNREPYLLHSLDFSSEVISQFCHVSLSFSF